MPNCKTIAICNQKGGTGLPCLAGGFFFSARTTDQGLPAEKSLKGSLFRC